MSGKSRVFPMRGDVYWVNLDPTVGNETKKRRPALVVSNDIGNEMSNIIMVAPVTSKVKNVYPFEVRASVQGKAAKIMLNQCRAIDKARLGDKIESVDQEVSGRCSKDCVWIRLIYESKVDESKRHKISS